MRFLSREKILKVLIFAVLSLCLILDVGRADYIASYWPIISIWAVFFALAFVFLDGLIKGKEKEAKEKPTKRQLLLDLIFIALSFYFIFTAPMNRSDALINIAIIAATLFIIMPLAPIIFFIGNAESGKKMKTGLENYHLLFFQLFFIAILVLPESDFLLGHYKLGITVVLLLFSTINLSLDAKIIFRGK